MVTNEFIFGFPFFKFYNELMNFNKIIDFNVLQLVTFESKLITGILRGAWGKNHRWQKEWQRKKCYWEGVTCSPRWSSWSGPKPLRLPLHPTLFRGKCESALKLSIKLFRKMLLRMYINPLLLWLQIIPKSQWTETTNIYILLTIWSLPVTWLWLLDTAQLRSMCLLPLEPGLQE